nr:hypothetical protein [Tanacetum cinerariifolium]
MRKSVQKQVPHKNVNHPRNDLVPPCAWKQISEHVVINMLPSYPGKQYVDGHVDIFDMVDIELFNVIALNKMVLQLDYKFEPLFYKCLRPLSSLDEGLYSLACDEAVCCLATLVRSFKLLGDYIEHGFRMVNSYQRPPQQFSAINLSFILVEPIVNQVRDDVMIQLSFDEMELDGKAGFGDVAGQVLAAVGLDSDNLIYPLTYALLESESVGAFIGLSVASGQPSRAGVGFGSRSLSSDR